MFQEFDGALGLAVAAGEYIHGYVSAFRPGVHAEVGLLHHHDACHTLGREVMENLIDHPRAGYLCRQEHHPFYRLFVIEPGLGAIPELSE